MAETSRGRSTLKSALASPQRRKSPSPKKVQFVSQVRYSLQFVLHVSSFFRLSNPHKGFPYYVPLLYVCRAYRDFIIRLAQMFLQTVHIHVYYAIMVNNFVIYEGILK